MKILTLAAVAAASLGLASCATGAKLSPEQAHQLFSDFHDAGCGGRVDLDAGAATGQLGGAAHLTLALHGECPTAPPKAAPADAGALPPA